MNTNREYGIEARIILKKLQDAGCRFIKTGDSYGDDYYDISCEGLSIGKIAYNLWNLEDSMLVVRNPEGDLAWARFVFGNGWGELVADYSMNLLGKTLPYEESRLREKTVGLWDYQDWRINDVLNFFGITRKLTDIIDEIQPHYAATIYRGNPHNSNEGSDSDNADKKTQEE
tara:strand:+ start:199 stop:714 length:516 start_codon:yes stop_codon:yes gene_type:complete